MAYKLDIYDAKGKKVKTTDLDKNIFNDDNINEGLIHEFVVMYLANQRVGIAHTKTRGEVQTSGRKLYRQKGTGRARVGDAGSPIRRKGGVAFGPRNDRNFSKDMPKKMKRKALFGALSIKAKQDAIIGLKSLDIKEPKTKQAYDILVNLNLGDTKTLVVLPEPNEATTKSLRNIPNVKYMYVQHLNAYDLINHAKVLILEPALAKMTEIFAK